VTGSAVAITALRFGATGVLNTVVGLIGVIAARELAGLSEYGANAFGYAVGLSFGFLMNRSWTFADRRKIAVTAPRYVLSFLISYGANLAVLATALGVLGIPANLAQAGALATYSIVFFVLCRWFVFRRAA
jgi:putative flippase GtrA